MSLSALTRSWPTLAAWGAGLIQLGVGAGLLTAGAGVAPRVVGVLLVLVGASALVWGLIALAQSRMVAPRTAMAIAVIGTVAAALALAADPARVSVHAVGISVLLLLTCGLSAAIAVRRQRSAASGSDAPAVGHTRAVPKTSVAGLIVGCVIVAGLVTPALGATEAGRLAPSHSDHPLFSDEHGGH